MTDSPPPEYSEHAPEFYIEDPYSGFYPGTQQPITTQPAPPHYMMIFPHLNSTPTAAELPPYSLTVPGPSDLNPNPADTSEESNVAAPYGHNVQGLPPKVVRITCPECSQVVTTRVEYQNSTTTHLIADLLCLCLCWPCVWIPFCIHACKNVNHFCPSCNCFVGTSINRMSCL